MTVRRRRHSTTGPPQRFIASLAAAALALIAVSVTASPAHAVSDSGPTPFGLTPTPLPDGQPRPYFQLALASGRSQAETVVVTNQASTSQTLKISSSTGVTAPNSGSAFDGYFRPCSGTACWINGLPPTVTLGPGAAKTLPFTVTVPPDAAPKQYLAGITAQPQTPPAPVTVGGNKQASAHAIIINQISVGVAVTVGPASQLATRLNIPTVTGAAYGPLPRLLVDLHNTGQTFTGAKGTASCSVPSQQFSVPITADTILPGDAAVLPVNAPQIKLGTTVTCTVRLSYGPGLIATWTGTITMPAGTPTNIVHTAKGTYSNLPIHSGTPTWAILLIILGVLAASTTTALTVVLLRRRRPTPGASS